MKAYAFDRFVLRAAERRLLRDGTSVPLPAKSLELLTILIEARGEAVSREQLYERLWPGGCVEDGNLTQTVYMLRRALDPARSERIFVETLPKRGYRFALSVREEPDIARTAALHRRLRLVTAACLAFCTSVLAGTTLKSDTSPLRSEAAVAYALGVYHWNMRTPSELDRSIVYFNETVRQAPQSALGYAGLAEAYAIKGDGSEHNTPGERKNLTLAERYRDEALARDPDNVEALTVAGFLAERFYMDRDLAERDYARALSINPRYATAHHWRAVLHFMEGNIPGAVAEWEEAHRLEPTSEVISRWLGTGYFYAHRPDRAVAILGETLSLQPYDAEAWLNLSAAQEQRGDYRSALAALDQLRKYLPHKRAYTYPLEARISVLQHHGNVDPGTVMRVRSMAAKAAYGDVFAYFFTAIGRPEEALTFVRRDHTHEHGLGDTMLRNDPRLDRLHTDARFRAIFN